MLSAAISKQSRSSEEERTTEHPANGSFRHEPKENMVKPHG
jgi:hypothetical protein